MKQRLSFISTIILALALSFNGRAQVIITVAGKGVEGYTGDGGLAINCQIHWPQAIALDAFGNKYIADGNNNVIRKITNGGDTITTIVGDAFGEGTGTGAYAGDGGQATAARLFFPSGIAVDPAGNMFIADQGNNRIRKVDLSGIITTVAGTGGVGYTGDGAAATNAQLYKPTRVVLDASGNMYIADASNNVIRKVDVASGNISTIAGTGTAGYSGDGGPAISAQLNHPMDMAVDASGNVFICDNVNNRIRKVDASGNISTYAGIGIPGYSGDSAAASNANIYGPAGIVIDAAGNIYFSDLANSRVRRISAGGMITTYAGNGIGSYGGDGGPAKSAKVSFPEGLALNSTATGLYIADMGNHRIRYVSGTLGVPGMNSAVTGLTVYPNPNNGAFTVKISSDIDEPVKLVITNVTGQKVTESIAATNREIRMNAAIPPGMYFLSAITSGGILNEKIIVR
jgi:trimeric autotransporter adhesin